MQLIEIIPDKYAISSDVSCVTVCTRKANKKTKEKSWSPTWYYSDYKQALAGILNRKIQSEASQYKNFVEMIGAIRKAEFQIEQAIKTKIQGNEPRINFDVPVS